MPIIDAVDGDFSLPNTTVTLDGSGSFGAFGVPSIFAWAVASVPGTEESQTIPPELSPTYALGGAGEYVFQLKVYDQLAENGGPCGPGEAPCVDIIPSCVTASKTVTVKDATPLIVELVWDTPGDPDQLDTGPGWGADLDLHVHDGSGQGPDYDGDGVPDSWFDIKADAYWLDTSPNWGAPGAEDDPLLALEDPDGAGPERLEYHLPPPGGQFTIGVHAWSDYGFGASIATVRIYYFENLLTEITDVVLESGDLWEVATISWPKCTITPAVGAGGGPKITPAYPNPFQ